jgi:hypothetical protein
MAQSSGSLLGSSSTPPLATFQRNRRLLVIDGLLAAPRPLLHSLEDFKGHLSSLHQSDFGNLGRTIDPDRDRNANTHCRK